MSDFGTFDQRSEKEIFFAALDKQSLEERAAFLDGACGKNAQLKARVQALLADHLQRDSFMKQPAAEEHRPTLSVSPVNDAPADEAVGERLGRYKLLEKVGEGGCGVVYVAEQLEPVRRRVALKVIKLGMDTKAVVARFEAERQALAMMDHPNIARVLDAGATENGRPFFVMELVRGIRITDYCDQNNLSTKERLDLFMKVCLAIQHAHQKGIIHRDIKPSNILVTLHDGVPVPKVIDFGIAKATEGRLADATVYTQLHQFIGTPAYMSPEQAEMSGLDIDTRSDIYSLGVLLYELLAGSTPFDAKELMAAGIDVMRKMIREKEPMRPSTRLATLKGDELTTAARRRSSEAPKLIHLLKGELDWIVMKCLEKDRTRRYETANGLALDVKRYLQQEPVSAVAPSAGYRLRKFARRHRTALAAACAMAGLLVAGIVVSSWQAYRAMRYANEAELQRQAAVTARLTADKARVEAENARASEAAERRKVEEKSRQLAETLSQQEQQKITEVLAKEGPIKGLPLLALALRRNPDNYRAALRLLSILTYQDVAQLISQKTYEGRLLASRYGPQGPWILTSSPKGDLWLWDYRRTEPLAGPLLHTNQVLSASFTPSGRSFLVTLNNWRVEIWPTTDSKAPSAVLPMERAPVSTAFSPDESRLATVIQPEGGDFRTQILQVWDLGTGQALSQPIPYSHLGYGLSVAFTKDGSALILKDRLGMQNTRSKLEIATGKMGPKETFTNRDEADDQTPAQRTMVYLNTLSGALSLGAREVLLPWAGAGVARSQAFGRFPLVTITAENLSPNETELLAPMSDGKVSLWDVGGHELLPLRFAIWPSTGPDSVPFDAPAQFFEIGPDGRRILTVDRAGTAKLWNGQTGKLLVDPLAEAGKVRFARLSPDGQKVLVAAADGRMRLWEASTGNAISVAFGAEPGDKAPRDGVPVVDVSFSQDGSRVIAAWRDGNIQLRDAQSTKLIKEFAAGGGGVTSAQLSPNALCLATVHKDRAVRVWNVATGDSVCPPFKPKDDITACQFSPDGRNLAIASEKTVSVWELPSGKTAVRPFQHDGVVRQLFWRPDGGSIVTVSEAGPGRVQAGPRVVLLWDVRSGAVLQTIKEESWQTRSVSMSQDGKLLLIVGDQRARLWDVITGTPLTEEIKLIDPGQGFAYASAFSADAGWFGLAGATRESLKVWELPQVSGPAPEWLPRLAEALAGQKINEQGVTEAAAPTDLLALRSVVLAAASNDGYHRWGRWFFAERGSRTISPDSPLTLEGYVRGCIDENTHSSLQEALRLDPDNPKALSAYLKMDWEGGSSTDPKPQYLGLDEASIRRMNRDSALQAEQMADRLLRAMPGSAVGLHVKALALSQLDQPQQALETLERARPSELGVSFWQTKAAILEKLARNDDAYATLSAGIEETKALSPADSSLLLRERAVLLRRQNRLTEAGRDLCQALAIPPRDVNTPSHLIDLSLCYTASLTNVGVLSAGNDALSELPVGIHSLAGTEFDIRGIIFSRQNFWPSTNIYSIPVGVRCQSLEFLHGTSMAVGRNSGVTLANYTVHFADNQILEVPVVLGRDSFDWFFYPEQPEASEAPTVWVGLNERSRGSATFTRLFRMRWVNPHPEIEIKSVDFQPLLTGSLPFLVAVTADPVNSAPLAPMPAPRQTYETIHQAAIRRPEHLGFSYAEALLLERAGRTNDALEAFSSMVKAAAQREPPATNELRIALDLRSSLFRRLGQSAQAQADLLRSKAILPRAPGTAANLIDLSPYYNAGLTEDFHRPVGDSALGAGGLSGVPQGMQKFGGVEFDVRGVIQLAGHGLSEYRPDYPNEVRGIPLHRKLQRLEFLHATGWGSDEVLEIGHFMIHYANGETRTMPIVCGKDVSEWRFDADNHADADRPQPVWTGVAPDKRSSRLFKTSWDNPLPELEVASVDYISAMTKAAPFLVAITAE